MRDKCFELAQFAEYGDPDWSFTFERLVPGKDGAFVIWLMDDVHADVDAFVANE